MFCKFCGKQVKDDSSFCEFCGRKLVEMPNQTEVLKQTDTASQAEGAFSQGDKQPGEEVQGQAPQPQEEFQKRRKKGVLIAGLVVAVCVVAAICGGIFFLFQSQEGKEEKIAVAHQISEAMEGVEQAVQSGQEKMALAAQEKQAQEEAAAKEAAEKEAAEKEAAEREAAEREAAAKEKQRLAEEEAKKNAWKKAYKEYLENGMKNDPEMAETRVMWEDEGLWDGLSSFWIYLDDDDIPELVILGPQAISTYYMFTCQDGEVLYLGRYGDQAVILSYLERESMVRYYRDHFGTQTDEIYHFDGNTLETWYTGGMNLISMGEEWIEEYENPPYTWEDVREGQSYEGEGKEKYYSEINRVFDTSREKVFPLGYVDVAEGASGNSTMNLSELYRFLDD